MDYNCNFTVILNKIILETKQKIFISIFESSLDGGTKIERSPHNTNVEAALFGAQSQGEIGSG